MPRRKSTGDDALRSLVDSFVAQITALTEARLMDRVAAALGGALGPTRAGAPRQARQAAAGKTAPRTMTVPRPCPVPGCGKPGRGPRFRWLCDEHKGIARTQWLAIKEGKAAPKPAAKKAPKPKAAAKPTYRTSSAACAPRVRAS